VARAMADAASDQEERNLIEEARELALSRYGEARD
jgi:hypothetical protein